MSIRLRLALWYGSLLCLTLAAFAGIVYFNLQKNLQNEMDISLSLHSMHIFEYMAGLSTQPAQEDSLLSRVVQAFDSPDMFTQFIDPSGEVVVSAPALGRTRVPVPQTALLAVREGKGAAHYNTFVDLENPSRRLHLRVRLEPLANSESSPKELILVTAISFSGIYEALRQLIRLSIWTGLIAVPAAILIGLLLAASALRPIAAITRTAQAIARSGNLNRRLPESDGHDELARLSLAFNEMLESLAASFQSQRRFVADASHELRAPLTTIRGNLDLLAEPGAIPAGERERVLNDVRDEVDRLSRLVHELLDLARADAGLSIKPAWVELDRLALEVLRPYALQAKDRRVTVSRVADVRIYADPDRLSQLLIILLDNAVRYTTPGDEISLGVWQEQDVAYLQVADTGMGIAPEHLPHIFERFYRADASRSRAEVSGSHAGGGAGLGLAIARHIAQSHQGEITVNSTPGKGTTFTVRLPAPRNPI